MERGFSRRSFLRTAALGSAGLVVGAQIKAQPARLLRKPNLIVFLPDQQRADTLARYGASKVLAPNLDKLASQSFVFEQAYVTHPVCAPSRSSLMTGTWPHTNGCTHNGLRLQEHFHCLPEMIGDADYHCAYMGKWHLGDEVFAQHGFEEWVSIIDPQQSTFGPGRDPKAVSDYNKFLTSRGLQPDGRNGNFTRHFATMLPIELSKPKFLETKVCDFLERYRHDPFVLFVGFFEPHPPYNGPLNKEHPLDQVDPEPTVDHTFAEDMPLRYRLLQEKHKRQFARSPDNYLKTKQRYLGLVTEIDRSIGAILAKLEELGLADTTIVVHTSDHGDMMGAHRLFGKKVLFQEAARVPYLIRMPDQRQTVSIPQQVSHIDFLPTMLDLLGKAPHQQCAGKSWAPLLRGESIAAATAFVEWSPDRKRPKKHTDLATPEEVERALGESTRAAISPDGWKLCLRDSDKNELYNLRSDPREEQNLFQSGRHKHVIAQLTDEIHRWQESVGDTVKV
jgi:arylsulfatase A-like enzyme